MSVKSEWNEIYSKSNIGGFKTNDENAIEIRKQCEIETFERIFDTYFRNKNMPNPYFWKHKKINILDVGCGDGNLCFYFETKGYKVKAFDISEEAIKKLKERKSEIDFSVCDLNDFETEEKFDLIFLGGVFMYLDMIQVKTNFKKLKKMLNPNGIIVCRESVSTGNGIVEGITYYRNLNFYSELDYRCVSWLNECAIYHVAKSKLKRYGIEFMFPYLKWVFDLRNEIMRKIKRKEKIVSYYYLFF
jgi:SAM-dependent methyltransferase